MGGLLGGRVLDEVLGEGTAEGFLSLGNDGDYVLGVLGLGVLGLGYVVSLEGGYVGLVSACSAGGDVVEGHALELRERELGGEVLLGLDEVLLLEGGDLLGAQLGHLGRARGSLGALCLWSLVRFLLDVLKLHLGRLLGGLLLLGHACGGEEEH